MTALWSLRPIAERGLPERGAVSLSLADPAVAAQLARDRGGVDILVNNAGIARSDTPAEAISDEHWLSIIDVNLNGVFRCCRAFGKAMLAKGGGVIVNIGSMSGSIVNADGGYTCW